MEAKIATLGSESRHDWILKYLHMMGPTRSSAETFIQAYRLGTGMNRQNDGKCKQLAIDLAEMFKLKLLSRDAVGTSQWERDHQGLSSWYYRYAVAAHGYIRLNDIQLNMEESIEP